MIIDKAVLAPKLAKLKTVLPSRILENAVQGVLFKDNCLFATNLEIGVKTTIEVDSEEEFIIPARAIELIDNLPEGPIEIIPDKSYSITIKAQNIKNKFQSHDPKIFPELGADATDFNIGSISSTDFEKAVKSVLYAVDSNNARVIMSGVCFDSSEGTLNIVGTDGHRMSWYKMNYNKEFSFIAPKTSIQKLLSIGISGEIEISYDPKNAIFKSDEYTLYTRLLEGQYVAYKSVFKKPDNSTIINRKAFLEGLKRCMICMDEKNRGAVKLKFEGEKLTILANSSISEYAEVINLEAAIDESITIGFNGVYVADCLKSFEGENVEISFGTAVQPMVVDDGELSAIVLPVRLNS